MKKTFLFVHDNANSRGSAVSRAIELMRLASEKHEVLCVCPGEGHFVNSVRAAGFNVVSRDISENTGIFSYVFSVSSFILFLSRRRVFLVHFIDYRFWRPAEFLAARILKLPVIVSICSHRDKDFLAGEIKHASLIVCNSNSVAKIFRENGLADKTRVIYNFVDLDVYSIAVENKEVRALGALTIAYVGMFQEIKGVEYLLRAVKELCEEFSDLQVVLVGEEKESAYEAKLRAEAHRLAIAHRVHFLGFISDIATVMKSVDLLVQPSLEEAFGFSTLEAMASGTPVVACKVGGLCEIVEDKKTGFLVSPGSSQSIAKACGELLREEDKRSQFAAQALYRVKKHFSKEVLIQEWKSLYGHYG